MGQIKDSSQGQPARFEIILNGLGWTIVPHFPVTTMYASSADLSTEIFAIFIDNTFFILTILGGPCESDILRS